MFGHKNTNWAYICRCILHLQDQNNALHVNDHRVWSVEPCDAALHTAFLLQFPRLSVFCIVLCPDCYHGFPVARTTARCFTSTTCQPAWPRTCWGNASRFLAKQTTAKSSSAMSKCPDLDSLIWRYGNLDDIVNLFFALWITVCVYASCTDFIIR